MADPQHGNHGQNEDEQQNGSSAVPAEVLQDLIDRAKSLLSELEQFRARLRTLRQEGSVELAHFRGNVQSELNMLEKLSQKTETTGTGHVARSSNLPFLETVWAAAKRSKDLVALQKRVILNSGSKSASQKMKHVTLGPNHKHEAGSRPQVVLVDLITDAGRTWSKCSLVTNTRLLFDLAKQGWESDGSDEYSDSEGVFGSRDAEDDDDDDRDVPLVKTAKELAKATKLFRIRTKHATVNLILPRIKPGESAEVDRILYTCRKTGVNLICGDNVLPRPSLEESMLKMAPDPFDAFSDTINIDCTILLALVSDFSHAKISKEPWFHKALQRQVEIEGNENLLPSLLYPAMRDRRLVCTQEAVSRMREIVSTIGTPSERARTTILLGDETSKQQLGLVQDMQKWSEHKVPDTWRLPIEVVDKDESDCLASLPPEAAHVCEDMTAINQSVFLYGWAAGITTITSNRGIVKQIENGLDQYIDLDDSVWPKLYLCPTARSLVGKEKEKRGIKKEDREGTAWRMPDPLRREEQRRNGLDVLSMREGYEVEDLRPDGYPCDEVLEAKNAVYPQQ